MLRLYNTLLWPLRGAALVWAWRRRRAGAETEAGERLARSLPPQLPGAVWIHGSSVGEARIVGALARALRSRGAGRPVVVSAFTPTGRAALPAPPEVDHAFHVPLDFPGLPARVIAALRPSTLAIVETELWPNLLHEARLAGLPVGVINARLSVHRMARYRRYAPLYRPLARGLTRVGAQSGEDAARWTEIGVPAGAVSVTGNVKYDLEAPRIDRDGIREEFALPPNRPVLVAGSTRRDEESPVLDGFLRARRSRPDLLLVLAPRHPERSDEVERLVRERGLTLSRLSGPPRASQDRDVLLVDMLGKLGRLYGAATLAFVGGTLVPVGGHNVLEPAALDVPVLFGPHTQNFADPAEALVEAGGGFRVVDGDDLGRRVAALLTDPAARARAAACARRVIERNRGALVRSVDLILAMIDGQESPGGER